MLAKTQLRLGTILLLLSAAPTLPYGEEEQDRNHPEVVWKTAETEHFRFHYERRLRSVAEACAARAEAVYPEVVALYGHEPPNKIDFVVQDEDYSNGWAIASLNTMSIWSADLGFSLRGSKDWIRDVVAHEFAHVISIQTSAKLLPWIPDLQVGWGDASDGRLSSSGWLLWSLNPYSMSLAEGTAQWTSERMGGDRWDTHRRMIVRTAALSDSFLPWGRLGSFSGTGLDFEKVYGHGFGMVRYLAATRGEAAVRDWWKALSRWDVQTASGALHRATGISGDSLWREWVDSMRTQARTELERARPLVEGRRLFGQAFDTRNPRWYGDSTLLFSSNRGSDFQVNSLWGCDFRRTDSADRFWVVSPIIRSRFSVDTVAAAVWFHSGRFDDARGRPTLEAFSTTLRTGSDGRLEAQAKDDQRRITRGWHAFAPEVRGDSLLVVSRHRSGFRLGFVPADGLEIPPDEGSVFFPPRDSLGEREAVQIYQAVWAPDSQGLAVDWSDGIRRRVDLIRRDGTLLRRLGDTLSEWRDPAFSPDGRSVWLASDRTGIFNLYRQDLATGEILQATSVAGGAFQPAPSPDGLRVAYSGWDRDGFSLWMLDTLELFPLRTAEPSPERIAPPAEETWDLASREAPYSAIPRRPLFSPIVYAQRKDPLTGADGETWSWMAGGRLQLLDPLRRNTLLVLGLLDLSHGFDYLGTSYRNLINPRQEKTLYLAWENRSWWPTLSLEASYQSLRGEDTVSVDGDHAGEKVLESEPWALHVLGASAGARYSLTRDQKIHAAIGYSRYDFDLYESSFRFEAYHALSPTLFWTWLRQGDGSLSDMRGTFARVQWTGNFADLTRTGSFRDVFQQNADGSVTARMNGSQVQDLAVDLRGGFANPLFPSHTLELDGGWSGIVHWSSEEDTLNDFYRQGLSLPGYPTTLPGSKEERLFQGTQAASFSASYRLPLWEARRQLWIWFLDTWSAGAGLHAGRAWDGTPWSGLGKTAAWDFARSATWETRLSGDLHHAYPFHLSLSFARAFDEPADLHQKTLDLFGVPLGAHRIAFGVNVGLDEWAIIDQPVRRSATLLPAPRSQP